MNTKIGFHIIDTRVIENLFKNVQSQGQKHILTGMDYSYHIYTKNTM